MMEITYKDESGEVRTVRGMLFTGAKDMNGKPMFEGDRVSLYIPALDEERKGTVVYLVDGGTHPSWLIRLDEPYRHVHLLEKCHGIPSYDTQYHYLDGSGCRVIEE